ncbi:MAG: HAD family hydrolase [Candidatus Hodarchaeales archaeon]|jgi:phosphoserine phosphatase
METKKFNIQLNRTCLIAFDFDGTLTTIDSRSSWQVVHEHFGTWKSHGKPILHRFMKGEISYIDFCKLDAEVWINKTEEDFQCALRGIQLREGANELVSFLKNRGCILAIISMGLSDVVERYANELKFDYWIANKILRHNNIITGDVEINIDLKQKGKILRNILRKFKVSTLNSIAIGDSSTDIEMFDEAAFSIAIEPSSDQVAAKADFVCQTTNFKELLSFFKSI